MESEFDAWSEYYDLIHPGLPGEEKFYLDKAGKSGNKVLELGCGTGRLSIPLAQSGCCVTGLDLSKGMLDVCSRKWSEESAHHGVLTPILGDMANFHFEERFDAILLAYRTFMHLSTQEQQLECLRCVYDHLAEDGVVLMNTWNPKESYITEYENDEDIGEYDLVDAYHLSESNTAIQHFHRVTCDSLTQHISEDHMLVLFNNEDREIKQVELSLNRFWTTVEELRQLFLWSGLKVASLYGSFQGAPLNMDSEDSIWVLKR